MIETLFVVNKPSSNHKEATRRYVLPSPSQENRVLDPKKAQNIAIALRALNVTIEEVCEALSEGSLAFSVTSYVLVSIVGEKNEHQCFVVLLTPITCILDYPA